MANSDYSDDDQLSDHGPNDTAQWSDDDLQSDMGGEDELDSGFNSMDENDMDDDQAMDDFGDPDADDEPLNPKSRAARAPSRSDSVGSFDSEGSPPSEGSMGAPDNDQAADDDGSDPGFDSAGSFPSDFSDDEDGGDGDSVGALANDMSGMKMSPMTAARSPSTRSAASASTPRSPRTASGPTNMAAVTRAGSNMCVVCGIKPKYHKNGKSYPTCGMTCATKYKASRGHHSSSKGHHSSGGHHSSSGHHHSGTHSGSTTVVILCCVCGKKPAYSHNGKSYPTCGNTCAGVHKSGKFTKMCCICGVKPAHSGYPTCGMTCAAKYKTVSSGGHQSSSTAPVSYASTSQPVTVQHYARGGGRGRGRGGSGRNTHGRKICVICHKRPVFVRGPIPYVTCGLTCLKLLCAGKYDHSKCNYCHRRPRLHPHKQCGRTCRDRARKACIECRVRPKLGKYHFCGRTCRGIAMRHTPGIREFPKGHVTYNMVIKKFRSSWKMGTCPRVKAVYKVVESASFLRPYDKYKKRVGNEHFRYHGTGRACKLGNPGVTKLCNLQNCAICNILRTSYKISLAKTSGAFGPGVYTSSASNKAYSYAGATGVLLLNKLALGRIRQVNGFNEVLSLPTGYDSVEYKRQNNTLNETMVYSNDAIRPVFMLVF